MSWQDRDYSNEEQYRQMHSRPAFGSRLTGSSVVTWLLVANVIIFLLDNILTYSTRAASLSPSLHGHFSVEKAIYQFQVWRFLTYQFLHADLLHIFFNMLALYFFGPMVEKWWGSARFLAYYLICGIGSVIIFTILAYFPDLLGPNPLQSGLVGASGCIFGVLVAAAMVAPNQRVMLLFPPIPMKMRTLVLVFLGIAVLSVIVGSVNAGGEAAHLGGAAMGFLLMKQPILLGFTKMFDAASRSRRKNERQQRANEREAQRQRDHEAEVDRILVKVKEHGLQSLTEKEKKALQRETDRKQAG